MIVNKTGRARVNQQEDLSQYIEDTVGPSLLDLGYRVVCVMVAPRWRVQILIERVDESPVGIEDCTRAHRTASLLLDVADLIQTSYLLEVSSPGIERPLVKWQDYVRFCGSHVTITMANPLDGQKYFTGLLLETQQREEEMAICLRVDRSGKEEDLWLPWSEILKAHLKQPVRKKGKGYR
ncbi:MAG: ribosome maturation factor RimP [Holosporales bacterium]|jgi:ribosome maturation factor RimP|nr:ribosome maturation factor RimP [Holosporales bacterium]